MKVVEWLKGKKTYIVSSLMVLASLLSVIVGDLSLSDFFSSSDFVTLLNGLGLGTLRAGISKS